MGFEDLLRGHFIASQLTNQLGSLVYQLCAVLLLPLILPLRSLCVNCYAYTWYSNTTCKVFVFSVSPEPVRAAERH